MDFSFFNSNYIMETIVLLIGLALFLFALVTWHLNPKNGFDMKTVLTDATGKFSLAKFGQFVALLTSTWVVVYQTRHTLMTEWLFVGYLLTWSGSNLANKWLDKPKQPPTEEPTEK